MTSRLAQISVDLEKAQKQKEVLSKAGVKDKAMVDALEKELKEMNKALDETKLKLVQTTEMEKAFIEADRRVKKLETEV